MEEFGDWIYIIVMVVVGISSMYSSAKKKQRQQQTQMPLPVPSAPSEPWHPTTPPTSKQKGRKQPPPVPGQMNRHQPSTSTIPIVETNTLSETHTAQEEENTLAIALDFDEPEAFRKAVIYSEILHRKYL